MRFKQRPRAALVAMLCLALGISASAMSTGFLDAAVLRPFNVQRAGDVVVLWEADLSRRQDLIESLPTFLDWERDASSFESMAAFGPRWCNSEGSRSS